MSTDAQTDRSYLGAFVTVLSATLILALLKYYLIDQGYVAPDSIFDYLLGIVVDGLVVVAVLEILLRYQDSNLMRRVIAASITQVLTGKLKALDKEVQNTIVKESINSRLGDHYGTILFNEFIQPYIGGYKHYRDNFHYSVKFKGMTADSMPAIEGAGSAFVSALAANTDRYNWNVQNIRYIRKGYTDGTAAAGFVSVHFYFSDDDLERSFRRDDVFMREVLSLDPKEREALHELLSDEKALEAVIRDVFCFRAWGVESQKPLTFTVVGHKGTLTNVTFIEIQVENESGHLEGSGCEIEFRMPWLKESTKFVMMLPVPTTPGAQLRFEKTENQRDLSMTSFLSQLDHDCYTTRIFPRTGSATETIEIETTKWTFPKSGVVYHWRQV
ncbi:hypothetical protein [Pseudokordiimonas caeni]|uniref:hypothetical protein n=1 Tax=Pseudokordiimonas caeni TaxID=2997908 RepID=UPI002811592D|nr:hypothetical protein [Pseudokordiimonas caeni]